MESNYLCGLKAVNAETYSDFQHNHSEDLLHNLFLLCIYTYTCKQIKVIFYVNPSQRNMLFLFNASSELTLFIQANREYMEHFQLVFSD